MAKKIDLNLKDTTKILNADPNEGIETYVHPPTVDRDPITTVPPVNNSANTQYATTASVGNKIAKATLPKSYIPPSISINSIDKSVTGIYDKSVKDTVAGLSAVKTATKRAIPFTSKFIPRIIAEKLKKFGTKNKVDPLSIKTDTENTEEITSTLQLIFGAQRIDADLRESAQRVYQASKSELGKQEFQQAISIQGSIATGVARLVGYQDTVLDNYYRKSLELQYRHYFSTRDILAHSKISTVEIIKQLGAITKNTALPNEVKVKSTEAFHAASRAKIISYIHEATAKKLRPTMLRAKSILNRELTNFGGNISGVNSETRHAGLGIDPLELVTSTADRNRRGGIGDKLSNSLKTYFPKINSFIEPLGNKAGRIASSIAPLLKQKMTDAEGEGFYGTMGNLMGNDFGKGETIRHNLHKDAIASVPWDMLSRRTLIEIIPGFMSRSLEQITNIYNVLAGTNEKAERQIFSSRRESFVTASTAKKDINRTLKSKVSTDIKKYTNEIIDYVDPANTLTIPERIGLALELTKDSSANLNFDPTKYGKTAFLQNSPYITGNTVAKVSELFTTAFGLVTDTSSGVEQVQLGAGKYTAAQQHYNKAFSEIKAGVGNFSKTINSHYASGETELLKEEGLVDKDSGRIDRDYRYRLIREMLEMDDVTKFHDRSLAPVDNAVFIDPNKRTTRTGKKQAVANTRTSGKVRNQPAVTVPRMETTSPVTPPPVIAPVFDPIQLDALLAATETNAFAAATLLERIAIATEAMQLNAFIAGTTTPGASAGSSATENATRANKAAGYNDDTLRGIGKSIFSKIWGSTKKIVATGLKVRAKVKPVVRKLFSIPTSLVKSLLPITKSSIVTLSKGALALSKFTAKHILKAAVQLPGRIAAASGKVFRAGKWVAKQAVVPLRMAKQGLTAGSSWLGRKIFKTASNVPGRIVSGIKRAKVPLKMATGFGAALAHGAGNLLDKFSGKSKKPMTPLGIVAGLVGKLQSKLESKDDQVLATLQHIYGHMVKAFPLKDSEQKEAERVGGVKDIIAKRALAKKAKLAQRAARKKAKAGGLAGAAASVLGGAKEEAEDSGLVDAATGGAGAWALGKLGSLASKAKGLFTGARIATTAATTVSAVATGGSLMGGGTMAATAATAAANVTAGVALASNPIGWALLAGATAYAGYKGYKAASRRTKLQPLELLRFLQYGIPVDNMSAVVTMRYFEEEMGDFVMIPATGAPTLKMPILEIWAKYCSEFGGLESSEIDLKNFTEWFFYRCMPVYVKHSALVKVYSKVALSDIDADLPTDLKFKFVTAAQFGPAEAEVGMKPLLVTASPWKDIALADNIQAIDLLSKQIINLAKRGEDVSLKNLDTIQPTIPTLAPKIQATPTQPLENADKNINVEADKLAGGDKSFKEKAIDWSKEHIIDPSSRALTNITEGGKALYEKGKDTVKKAVTWTNKNVIQPVANSLAGLIRGAESGKEGYNAYNRGTVGNKILGPVGKRELTKMPIQEILDDNKRASSDPLRLFAVGKYQMIPTTLLEGVKALGIDPATTLYDENTQERLFSGYLLDKKHKNISAFIKGKNDNGTAAVSAAASEWASLADPATGASKYGNGNKASVSAPTVLAAMTKSKGLYQQFISQGMDEDTAYQKAISSDGSTTPMSTIAPVGGVASTEPVVSTPATASTPMDTVPPAPSVGPTIAASDALTPSIPTAISNSTLSPVTPVAIGSNALPAMASSLTPTPLFSSLPINKVSAKIPGPEPVPTTPVPSVVEPIVTAAVTTTDDLVNTTKAVASSAQQQRATQIALNEQTNVILTSLVTAMATKGDGVPTANPAATSRNQVTNDNSNFQKSTYLPEAPTKVSPVINLTRKF